MIRGSEFSYEYVNSWEKFDETRLSLKNAFYNKLNMKGNTDQEHENSQQLWSKITPDLEDCYCCHMYVRPSEIHS